MSLKSWGISRGFLAKCTGVRGRYDVAIFQAHTP
jgi:hypothetical protein